MSKKKNNVCCCGQLTASATPTSPEKYLKSVLEAEGSTADYKTIYNYIVDGPATICVLKVYRNDYLQRTIKGIVKCREPEKYDEGTGKFMARLKAEKKLLLTIIDDLVRTNMNHSYYLIDTAKWKFKDAAEAKAMLKSSVRKDRHNEEEQ